MGEGDGWVYAIRIDPEGEGPEQLLSLLASLKQQARGDLWSRTIVLDR
ncbi:MAG: hypothetical protein L7T24_01520 [Luminiphilus sp.]|nr:hypothetical protein [Luminiphilus sp.]